FNAGFQNYPVTEIAEKVQQVIAREAPERTDLMIVTTASDDKRSYHISSELIQRELGFRPQHDIEDAVRDLVAAFRQGRLPDSMTDPRYYNIKTMQQRQLG